MHKHVEYIDHMGSDLSVVNAARVSFANQCDEDRTEEDNKRLIRYLAKHNHWTPFAHTTITLRMNAPVPIRTQCFKHKQGFVENEESRRYIDCKPEYIIPVWRKAVDNKKQGSGEEIEGIDLVTENHVYDDHMKRSIREYEYALKRGVCEEQARFYLPQGVTVNWYWTGSLSAYARFFSQRTDPHAQKEVANVAIQVGEVIEPLFPVCWEQLTQG